jgi:N-methylhydantoinase B
MKIPEGCILNAPRPYPVSVRHVIGNLLPDLMMGCLHQAVPERVMAEGASALWNMPLRGGGSVSGQARGNRPVIPDFEIITFNSGGTGGRPTQDGLNATRTSLRRAHDAGGATRNVAPIVFWVKELRADSGGAGARVAAPGRTMEVAAKGDLNSRSTPHSIASPTRQKAARGGLNRRGRRGRAEVREDAAHQGFR